jgi:CDP-glycerol glycerophosphotransferase (TagB/SpsB family)
LKKIQKDNQFDLVRNPKTHVQKIKWALRRISDEKPRDYVLVTSEYLRPIFSSAFNTKNTIICGYPRNDFLISDSIENVMSDDEKATYNMLENEAINNKIILYMPTFRESEHRFFELISISKLEAYLREHNFVFL